MSLLLQTRTARVADHSQMLAHIWQRNLPLLRERIVRLEAVANEAETGELTPEARSEALGLAHKLAGCLGMFGYSGGTEVARQLELLLECEAPIPVGQVKRLTDQLRAQLPV